MDKSDIMNNLGTKPSPCKTCPNHLAGVDKKLCLDDCQRLLAYQMGKEWEEEPIEIVELSVLDEEFKEFKEGLREPLSECMIPDCHKEDTVRGLCQAHYDTWRNGYIEHPVLGKFKVVRKQAKRKTEEEKQPMEKKKEVDLASYSVDLSNYEKIRRTLLAMSQDSLLPVGHLIITLIGEALARRNETSN